MSNTDLKEYGWEFGTYPKSCPQCPKDNEFLGSKDSHRCYNHAIGARDANVKVLNIKILKSRRSPQNLSVINDGETIRLSVM